MCKIRGETTYHLLLNCSLPRELRSFVFYMFGVNYTMPQTMMGFLSCWMGKFGRHRKSEIWKAVPMCVM